MMDHSFDLLPCGYVSFGDNGIIKDCNQTLSSWIGWQKDELAGKSIEHLFTLATRIFYNTHLFPLIKLHGEANEIFLSLKTKQQGDLPVIVNAKRTQEGEENIIRCIIIQVKERQKYEQELLNAKRAAEKALAENRELMILTRSLEEQAVELDRQYQQQVSIHENLLQFGKIISHDFQEPIRKIRVFADFILKNLPEHEN
jgi:sigma-B regulation protein RsbU (phosphoserine phosphatase)